MVDGRARTVRLNDETDAWLRGLAAARAVSAQSIIDDALSTYRMNVGEPRQLAHYRDCCRRCAPKTDLHVPVRLEPKGTVGAYVAYYQCPKGHEWFCHWNLGFAWYPDCPCDYCIRSRKVDA